MTAQADFDLASILACPRCHGLLCRDNGSLCCASCPAVYPIVEGVPLLFPLESVEADNASRALYDRVAAGYDEVIPSHVAEHYLSRRVSFIMEGMAIAAATEIPPCAVLDVGCGTGRLMAELSSCGCAAVGLDGSLGMLRVLRRRLPKAAVVGGHAQRLPFQDASFDLVVSLAALHHIARPDLVAAAISEMCRVAKPGGKILVWDHNPLNPYWPLIMARVPQDNGAERLIPLSEIERGLRAAGGRLLEHHRLGFTPDFLPRSILGFWRQLEALAEATPLLREIAAHNVVVARKE